MPLEIVSVPYMSPTNVVSLQMLYPLYATEFNFLSPLYHYRELAVSLLLIRVIKDNIALQISHAFFGFLSVISALMGIHFTFGFCMIRQQYVCPTWILSILFHLKILSYPVRE